VFNPEDPGFQHRTEQVNQLMGSWTVVGGTGRWLEAHLLARASYAGGLPQLMGCGICPAEVEDLVAEATPPVLVMLSESIAEDHGVALINNLAKRNPAPDILLMVNDGQWLGSNPLETCKADAIIDVHSFGTGTAIQALKTIRQGERFIDPRILWSANASSTLTPREQEALILLLAGASNPKIAHTMGISKNTARDYLSSVFKKLKVSTRAAAVAEAFRRGYGTTPRRKAGKSPKRSAAQ